MDETTVAGVVNLCAFLVCPLVELRDSSAICNVNSPSTPAVGLLTHPGEFRGTDTTSPFTLFELDLNFVLNFVCK